MATPGQLPRPEYPRPQFVRKDWINLNGTWRCAFDPEESGRSRGLPTAKDLDCDIIVPFCPESSLSGIGHRDFIPALWYQRPVKVPREWQDRRVLLNFGGADYECEVWIDGVSAGVHYGGSASFSFDITELVQWGTDQNLVVCCHDDTRSWRQPGGKQSLRPESHGCFYTRVTGIWQTVWMEPVAAQGLEDLQILPDLVGGALHCIPRFRAVASGQRLAIEVTDADGQVCGSYRGGTGGGIPCTIPLSQLRPWSPRDPHLYNLQVSVESADGAVIDRVNSYAGLRSVHVEGNRLFLNGKPVYLRMVLDQGYYPDGVWTAPSDAALKRDIELAMAAGFNGARLHQKVFEERYHYWADRLGFLTWGESANWGMDHCEIESARNFLPEWAEIVTRDRNHPSILAWTPFNESNVDHDRHRHDRLVRDAYRITRMLDPTRPVNGCSGWYQVVTDLYTAHTYQQDPQMLRKELGSTDADQVFISKPDEQIPYQGQPYFLDEFGGTRWIDRTDEDAPAWGYGQSCATKEEFFERLEGLVGAVCACDYICGYCYTQLTDVEQEQNGIYTFDRHEKFDMARIRQIFQHNGGWFTALK